MAHICGECGFEARSERGLKAHARAKHPPQAEGTVLEATDAAVAGAKHLTPMDRGAIEVLRNLARVIDGEDLRDPEAPLDNVTKPTYLKYADALGLTPLSRLKFDKKEDRSGSKLAHLRAVRGGKAG